LKDKHFLDFKYIKDEEKYSLKKDLVKKYYSTKLLELLNQFPKSKLSYQDFVGQMVSELVNSIN